jgi:hypothetical protein
MRCSDLQNPQSEIRSPKLKTDGRPAPAHIQLGAKWVEVRNGGTRPRVTKKMKSEFETWPATPVEASLEVNEVTCVMELVGVLLFNKRSSRGRPAIRKERGQRSEISGQRSAVRKIMRNADL